jgi:prepilin-type N-terminal cleavage/methylation domain-containing protein
MKKTFSSKKSAFSLIELSIVLIIIGLLIAGVTGGASLIKSSELRAAISEARGYAVAVNGFFAQYNALPGDYTVAIAGSSYAGSTNGGNSKIQYIASDASANNSESVVAWNQLIATGTIDSTLSLSYTAITTAQLVGTHMPASKIKFAGWHFDYRNNVGIQNDYTSATGTAEGTAAVAANQNVVVLTPATTSAAAPTPSSPTLVNGVTNLAYTTSGVGALTGPDALSIDTKVDDGFANAGRVRGLNPGTISGCYTLNASSNANYVVSNGTTKTCNLTFPVDVNS